MHPFDLRFKINMSLFANLMLKFVDLQFQFTVRNRLTGGTTPQLGQRISMIQLFVVVGGSDILSKHPPFCLIRIVRIANRFERRASCLDLKFDRFSAVHLSLQLIPQVLQRQERKSFTFHNGGKT